MYEQDFNKRVAELKDKIKSVKKELRVKDIAVEDKIRLNKQLEHFNNLIHLFNVKKKKLRELPNGLIVNVLILDKFIAKLKGEFTYELSDSEEGLVIEYWNEGRTTLGKPDGRLVLFDLSEHYIGYDFPNLDGGYQLGQLQTA